MKVLQAVLQPRSPPPPPEAKYDEAQKTYDRSVTCDTSHAPIGPYVAAALVGACVRVISKIRLHRKIQAAAQAAAGVTSGDTPQSVTSELSAGSPASATAGTLSGGELTADSQQRSLADDATPAEAAETS